MTTKKKAHGRPTSSWFSRRPARGPVVMSAAGSITWEHFLNAWDESWRAHPVRAAVAAGNYQRNALGLARVVAGDVNLNLPTLGAAMLAALSAPSPDGLAQLSTLDPSDQDIAAAERLARLATGISPRLPGNPSAPSPETFDALLGYALASMANHTQFWERPMSSLARASFVLAGPSAGGEWPSVPLPVEAAAKELVGVTFDEFRQTVAMIVAHGGRSVWFDLDASLQGLPDGLDPEAVRRVVMGLEIAHTDVRRTLLGTLGEYETVEGRVCAFFLRYPFVNVGGGRYVLAPSTLLLEALGSGLVLGLLQSAADAQRSAATELSKWLGDRFELYLVRLLRNLEPRHEVFPDFAFARGFRSCDAVVFDDRGKDSVVLIEAKLRGLPKEVYAARSWAAASGVAADRVATPIAEILGFLFNSRNPQALRGGDAGATELVERIHGTRLHTLLVVLPLLPSCINLLEFHTAVEARLVALLGERESKSPGLGAWVREYRSRHRVEWVALGSQDVDLFAGWDTQRRLGATLRRFVQERRSKSFIRHALKAPTWHNWLGCHGGYEGKVSAGTVAAAQAVWDWAACTLFGRRLSGGPGDDR